MIKFYIPLAILSGLLVIVYLSLQDINIDALESIFLDRDMIMGLSLSVVLLVCQNTFSTWRLRLLTNNILSWMQSLRVNIMCEFTSSITPSSVGGSALTSLYLYKEGIGMGKSSTITITTLFLDELFLCISCIAIVLIFPFNVLLGQSTIITTGVTAVFITVIAVIFLWTLLLYIALFHKAKWIKLFLVELFRLRLLRRWKRTIVKFSDDLITASNEVKEYKVSYWINLFALTASSWTCRYLIANALIYAFVPNSSQILIFVRQFVLWIVSIISPTPGGSGLSEYMFNTYYVDIIKDPSITILIVLMWRIITYYSYLILGLIVAPIILKRNLQKINS